MSSGVIGCSSSEINLYTKFLSAMDINCPYCRTPVSKKDVYNLWNKWIIINYKDEMLGQYNLFASEDIKKINIFARLIKSINYLIWGDA